MSRSFAPNKRHNHVDKLDKAVVDRIGSCITFNALDASTRKHILQRELEHNQTCLSDDDWMAVGQLTAGMTGRGIVSLCSDVALTSVYKAQAGITFDTFRDTFPAARHLHHHTPPGAKRRLTTNAETPVEAGGRVVQTASGGRVVQTAILWCAPLSCQHTCQHILAS